MPNITPRPEDFQSSDPNETREDRLARWLAEMSIDNKQLPAVAAAFSEEAARLQADRPAAPREQIDREALATALYTTNSLVVSRWAVTPPQEEGASTSDEHKRPNATNETLDRLRGKRLSAVDGFEAHQRLREKLKGLRQRVDAALAQN